MAKWNIKVFEPNDLFKEEKVVEYDNCTDFHVQRGTGVRSFTDSLGVKHVITCRFHATKIGSDGKGPTVTKMLSAEVGA